MTIEGAVTSKHEQQLYTKKEQYFLIYYKNKAFRFKLKLRISKLWQRFRQLHEQCSKLQENRNQQRSSCYICMMSHKLHKYANFLALMIINPRRKSWEKKGITKLSMQT